MNIDLSSLSNYILILTAWAGAFLAALWLSLIFWVYRDIRSRTRDVFMRILAILVAAILILRPARTLEDEYQQTLEEEALLQAIEDVQLCPGCGRRVKDAWQVCPNCHTKLKKPCHVCGRLMELPWNLCPYCGTPAPGMRREGMTMDEALRSIPVEVVETPKEEEVLPVTDENPENTVNQEAAGEGQ
jgi:RNA polymerase subunit RPABC4/transcription elongation factor Spt4